MATISTEFHASMPIGLAHPANAPGSVGLSRRLRGLAIASTSFFAALNVAACASAAAYNPSGLSGAQLDRVTDICRSVMGLQSSEPLILGPGDARLTYGENHYQGCIASLSSSLQSIDDANAGAMLDRDCRAQGLAEGSPMLAECVLQSRRSGHLFENARAMTATPVADTFSRVAPGSFYSARPHEEGQREQAACAALGLNPITEGFDSCVRDLRDTFYAIDNPQN